MSTRAPDLEAEHELDFGRLWGAVVARWWLPLAGVVAGIVIGYLASLGGGATYRAQAIVFLGQPLSPSGNAQIQSLATNPSTVRQIVGSEANVRRVAHDVGLPPGRLRGKVTVTPVAGAIARLGQTPLVAIAVEGTPPRKIAAAANELADISVSGVSGYVQTKITALRGQIASDEAEIASIDQRLQVYDNGATSGSTTDRLLILTQAGLAEQRRGIVEQDLSGAKTLLSLAQNVERSKVVTYAVPAKTSARSRRNSVVVVAFAGLILGLLAALLWEPLARAASRRPGA